MADSVTLSDDCVLFYVLRRSGCVGCLKEGRIERQGRGALNVYDRYGTRNDYLSGTQLRSWSLRTADKRTIDGWHHVLPADAPLIEESLRS